MAGLALDTMRSTGYRLMRSDRGDIRDAAPMPSSSRHGDNVVVTPSSSLIMEAVIDNEPVIITDGTIGV